MVRTTRSTALDTISKFAVTKKRKRNSTGDDEELPFVKQLRADGEDGQTNAVDDDNNASPSVHIASDDASKILDVLETIDEHGLLDRVFPVASSSTLYSLRTLLKEQHSFASLRSAVQHLFPITSHPRSSMATPAAQQLRFCELAQSMIEQAARRTGHIAFNVDSVLPTTEDGDSDSIHQTTAKYTLLQRLPSGDVWSSLARESCDGPAVTDLPTNYAELVAVLPAPSEPSSDEVPTLGAYVTKLPPSVPLVAPRKITCGSFLDYGPFSSFAPSFDQDGQEAGRDEVADILWGKEMRKRAKRSRLQEQEKAQGRRILAQREVAVAAENRRGQLPVSSDAMDVDAPHLECDAGMADVSPSHGGFDVNLALNGLQDLLSSEELDGVREALNLTHNQALRSAVQELLERNARALVNLEELQMERRRRRDGKLDVHKGDEEWQLAQGILDTLTVLCSLRPRTSRDLALPDSLQTPAHILHKLAHTLPQTPSHGWYGTLSQSRPTAHRDNSTIKIKAAAAVATKPATAVNGYPQAATSTSTPVNGTPAYAGYNVYANGQQYPQTYTAQQSQAYAQSYAYNYYNYGSQYYGTQAQGAYTPIQYYGNGYAQQPQQAQYATNWYTHQSAQPYTPTASSKTAATYYGNGVTSHTATPPPAIANTVKSSKTVQGPTTGASFLPLDSLS
ncbi:hypothetical protein FISHEDRAFT_78602 [Fistulina hepatica ATCC 64428]|uniref:Uncharacterized protein n=1 Tax=Fistulina hepatica ATCC 64428 TaxID=1128425 RepID=A0A0D7A0G0_9AGAR|nr:hypothetical protein FISHEDRAFT_78879 [Fistulina hepatica ATCC 64428]KIY43323.1 hypothetical protein FISHEDRAFT_78602 [Fistulina hepatica ATCC 64428]